MVYNRSLSWTHSADAVRNMGLLPISEQHNNGKQGESAKEEQQNLLCDGDGESAQEEQQNLLCDGEVLGMALLGVCVRKRVQTPHACLTATAPWGCPKMENGRTAGMQQGCVSLQGQELRVPPGWNTRQVRFISCDVESRRAP